MGIQFSEAWFRGWVNPPINRDLLLEQFTQLGFEVEGCKPVSSVGEKVVIGQVREVTQHPNADRLKVCKVDIGAGESSLLDIVCGATNVVVGHKYPVACVGSSLSPDYTIKAVKLRGVMSYGMLCSAEELGLINTSAQDKSILRLPEEATLGEDIRVYLALNDYSIFLDIPPNRGDCLSLWGLAREIGAFNHVAVEDSVCSSEDPKERQGVGDSIDVWRPDQVSVLETSACPKYLCRTITGIKTGVSTPLWLCERLRRSGIRPVSVVVDILNYVMLELGQPMHAFDLKKVNKKLEVRYANPKESLTLLNKKSTVLTPQTLVIADEQAPIAIAGVMGGLDSGVTEETTAILLESACFNALTVSYAARHYGLLSEAASRFERGVDPALARVAIKRATDLLLQILGGQPGPIIEKKSFGEPLKAILLNWSQVLSTLGVEGSRLCVYDMVDLLKRFGMTVLMQEYQLLVTPPSYRTDLTGPVDLIEEIMRLYGYQNLPSRSFRPEASDKISEGLNTSYAVRRTLCDALTQMGYHEIITYSFIEPNWLEMLGVEEGTFSLLLDNPLSSEMKMMRTSLWPGLLKAAAFNHQRQQERLRLFEVGHCFISSEPKPTILEDIQETEHIAGLIMGPLHTDQWGYASEQRPVDFFDLKGTVETLMEGVAHSKHWQFKPIEHAFLNAAQSAQILSSEGEVIGYLGLLSSSTQDHLGFKCPVYLFEFIATKCYSFKPFVYYPPSKYPMIQQDIAIIVDQTLSYQSVQSAIQEKGGHLLKSIRLFDIYRGAGIEEGKQSLAIRLMFQQSGRTLTEQEVQSVVRDIVDSLKTAFNAEMRMKK